MFQSPNLSDSADTGQRGVAQKWNKSNKISQMNDIYGDKYHKFLHIMYPDSYANVVSDKK